MGLKQDIVIVNEFSTKTANGGTRGGSPGAYVMRYMARKGATEDLTPVRLQDNDLYVTRYMARAEATEAFDSVSRIKDGMREAQGLGGVAFGATGRYDDGDISMSDRKVRAVSKDIQEQFEQGKTVMKTVISFDHEYLRRTGVIDEDFELEKAGDYRGNIDQMRLRQAIMHGMARMSRRRDDLEWVGVIQVDTKHVHCHLCMVDKGRGRLTEDGAQRGKLDEADLRSLRRGIDLAMDDMHPVKMMSSSVTYDRRNARCFIKRYTHETMAAHGLPQFLLACLPADKRKWRATSNAKDMQKPNSIVREYVEQVLAEPESGFAEARRDIARYADERAVREGLSDGERRQLIDDGEERVVTDCMNAVYQVLSGVPDERRRVWTPLMDAMAMAYEDMAVERKDDPMVEFGFRLRSYSSRLSHHRKERHKYREAVKAYEEARDSDEGVAADSTALYDFYKVEEEYNAMLMAKYQHFLSFLPGDGEYSDEFEQLLDYRDRMRRLRLLYEDPSCQRMTSQAAEDYGLRVYNMRGGSLVRDNPQVLERRLEAMGATYARMEDDFRAHVADRGLSVESDEMGVRLSVKNPYDFDDVKALDLHHLGYDFTYDFRISKHNADDFIEMANRRYAAYQGAVDYLDRSGQGQFIRSFEGRDITLMKDMADRMGTSQMFHSVISGGAGGRGRSSRTIRLDDNYARDIEVMVRATVQSVQFD